MITNYPVWPELGLFVLRVVLGVLTFAHGISKVKNVGRFAQNWDLSLPTAYTVTVLQTVTGLCLVVGVFVQPAAIINVGLNTAIVYSLAVTAREPFIAPGKHSWSEGLLFLTCSVVLALAGGGSFALDALLAEGLPQ